MSDPPAGWYANPQGEGQRYWDGMAWTGRFRRGTGEQGAGSKDYGARSNEHAVGWAVLFGVISFIALLAVLNPRIGGSSAYSAGRLFVPAAVAAAVVGLLARGTSRHLGWWVYGLLVPAAAAVLALALVAGDLREFADVEESRGEAVSVLFAPGAGDGWTVVETPETRAEVRRVTGGMENRAAGDFDSVVAAFYTHDSVAGSPVLFVGINGGLGEDGSADDALDGLLAGAYVKNPQDFDPGDVGGALGCGQAAAQGLKWVSCGWVGDERALLLRWNDQSVEVDQAAALTRDLRGRALR